MEALIGFNTVDFQNEERSWIVYDRDFVTTERDIAIAGITNTMRKRVKEIFFSRRFAGQIIEYEVGNALKIRWHGLCSSCTVCGSYSVSRRGTYDSVFGLVFPTICPLRDDPKLKHD